MCLAAALLAAPAGAQQPSPVRLDGSEQLFTVLCALRAGAPELAGRWSAPSSVVELVDRHLRTLDPQIAAPMRDYLRNKRFKGAPGEISAFVSLALVLNPPPALDFWLPSNQLPPDAAELADLPVLLKDFYLQAGIGKLWRSVFPSYARAIRQHQAGLARHLLATRGYLRLIDDTSTVQSYTVLPEWLAPRSLVSARSYGTRYFVVIHPEKSGLADSVRHQYLHYLLDSLMARNREDAGEFEEVSVALADRPPRLSDEFRRDSVLLVGESLIHAIEVRLEKLSEEDAIAELERREKDGYLFVRHFYAALAGFEQAAPSIRFYFPELLRGYSRDQEIARLSGLEFAPAEPRAKFAPAAAPQTDRKTELLRQAQGHLQAGDLAAARTGFDTVLRELDSGEPRALYGLGLVASAQGDRQAAVTYFRQVLQRAKTPSILGWANVYLGRIYDLEGGREQALAYYEAALIVSNGVERIEKAARQGLSQPFGQAEPPGQN